MSHVSKVVVCTALAFVLAACASSHDQPKPARLCPQVAIVRDLERAKDFGSATPSDAELVAIAAMKSVEGGCEYNEKGADVRFTLHMGAKKGPRLGGDKAAFPFFVSLISPEGTILKKDLMTANFEFGHGDKFALHDEKMHVFLPADQDASVEGYRVLMGFQLTEDQLKATRQAEEEGRP